MRNLVARSLADLKKFAPLLSYSTGGSLIQASILPLILLPFLARHISADEFGQLTIILSIVNYVLTVIGANLALNVYRRHKDHTREERKIFYGKIFWLGTLVSLVAPLLLFLFYDDLAEQWQLHFTLPQVAPLFVYLLCASVAGILFAFLASDLNYRMIFKARLFLFFGSFSVIGLYYVSPAHWSVGFAVGPMAYVLVLFIINKRNRSVSFSALPDMALSRSIGRDTLLFAFAAALINFVIYGDRWLLAEFGISFERIAAYSIAVQANMLLIFAIEQVAGLAIPLISNLKSVNDLKSEDLSKLLMVLGIFVIGVPVAGSLLGPLYIAILYGDAYWQSARPLFFLILAGTSLYPIQMLARGFLIRFQPVVLLIAVNGLAVLAMGICIFLLRDNLVPESFAIARSMGIGLVGVGYFIVVFLPLIRRLIWAPNSRP